MNKLLILLFFAFPAISFSQQDDAIMTPDGDVILSEVTIETIDIQGIQEWKTTHFYELTNNEGKYELKNGTKQEITRKIVLDGNENTLKVFGEKKKLKMYHDVETIIRSENQMILEFKGGAYMIIDNKNKTITLFETNFGFVYKMKV